MKKQLDRGNTPEEIRICNKIGPLRNQTPGWLLDSVNYINHPNREQLRLKAWKNCKVKNWNLSWESLTSEEAGRAFWRLSSEIRSAITGDNAVGGNDLESEEESENIIDGDDVPLDVLEEAVYHGPHRKLVVFPTGYRRSSRLVSGRLPAIIYEELDTSDDDVEERMDEDIATIEEDDSQSMGTASGDNSEEYLQEEILKELRLLPENMKHTPGDEIDKNEIWKLREHEEEMLAKGRFEEIESSDSESEESSNSDLTDVEELENRLNN